jgi:RpiR family carbohydrate utilization transcriptional regulator
MRDRILAVYDSLRPSERRLADYVARHGASVIRLTMPELANRAGVSQPTIARFCAALGYDGFKEFKLQFAQNVGVARPSFTRMWKPTIGPPISPARCSTAPSPR